MSRVALAAALLLVFPTLAPAAETPHVYGPGGPMPAMNEASAVFGVGHEVAVKVTAGPTPAWIEKARGNAGQVAIEPEYHIHRDAGVVLMQRGTTKAQVKDFATYLASPDGAKIFAKWGMDRSGDALDQLC